MLDQIATRHATRNKTLFLGFLCLVWTIGFSFGEARFTAASLGLGPEGGALRLPDYGLGIADLGAYLAGVPDRVWEAYRGVVLPLDLFYPVLLGGLLLLLSAHAGLKGRALVLPVAAAAVDYVENAGIIWIFLTDPGASIGGMLVSIATHVKFALYILSLLNVLRRARHVVISMKQEGAAK